MCGRKSRGFYLRFGGLLLLFLLFFSVCSVYSQSVGVMSDEEIIKELLLNLAARESLLVERESLLRTKEALFLERESDLETREASLTERERTTLEWENSLTEIENSWKSYADATTNTITLLRLGLIVTGVVVVIESVILGLSALAP